jgi:endonuclease/exonuclease/phosphatase family metal-dependent hydrolase
MKIISLNCYGGIVYEGLMNFIRENSDADIFCFQEMLFANTEDLPVESHGARPHLFQEIQRLLPDHEGKFVSAQKGFDLDHATDFDLSFGLAIFWRKEILSIHQKDFFVYGGPDELLGRDWSTLGCPAIQTSFEIAGQLLTVVTAHGTSHPANKLDTPDRIAQSQKILDAIADIEGEKIIMGDFNLFPNTKSIRMIEESGYRNLVVENNIKTTRGSHMRKLFPEYEHGKYGFQEFADYTFVTLGIEVESFEVPDLPISDHLPMILEIK